MGGSSDLSNPDSPEREIGRGPRASGSRSCSTIPVPMGPRTTGSWPRRSSASWPCTSPWRRAERRWPASAICETQIRRFPDDSPVFSGTSRPANGSQRGRHLGPSTGSRGDLNCRHGFFLVRLKLQVGNARTIIQEACAVFSHPQTRGSRAALFREIRPFAQNSEGTNMKPSGTTRRGFLKGMAAASAATPYFFTSASTQAQDANRKLKIASIGVGGSRGRYSRGGSIARQAAGFGQNGCSLRRGLASQ